LPVKCNHRHAAPVVEMLRHLPTFVLGNDDVAVSHFGYYFIILADFGYRNCKCIGVIYIQPWRLKITHMNALCWLWDVYGGRPV